MMTYPNCLLRSMNRLLGSFAAVLMALTVAQSQAHVIEDTTPRTAVISAFEPELTILRESLQGEVSEHSLNGVTFTTGTLENQAVVLFLSGISVVNAAMTLQLALDHFPIERIVFSGIAGGVDPTLNIGDVVIADRWGQYLEMLFAREVNGDWETIPFFDYPYANFGMMFPRAVTVLREGDEQPQVSLLVPGR